MMSANWVSVKIMVPSECRPTGFLPIICSRNYMKKVNISEDYEKLYCYKIYQVMSETRVIHNFLLLVSTQCCVIYL